MTREEIKQDTWKNILSSYKQKLRKIEEDKAKAAKEAAMIKGSSAPGIEFGERISPNVIRIRR
jgi:hypothetical protein